MCYRWLMVGLCLLVSCQAYVASTHPVRAETLHEALVSTYQTSPRLRAARVALRVDREALPQTLSSMRPGIALNMDAGVLKRGTEGLGERELYPRGVGFVVSQNLFDGAQTHYAYKETERKIFAAQESLRGIEQGELFAAVQAYMDVLRERSKISLWRKTLEAFQEQIRSTHERFSLGHATLGEVAQVKASLAGASFYFRKAQWDLVAVESTYQQVVGHMPGELSYPELPEGLLPRNLDDAMLRAGMQHPEILAAGYLEDAAEQRIKANQGALAPQVSLHAGLSFRHDSSMVGDQTNSVYLKANVVVPIYSGGATLSRIRQAKEVSSQRRFEFNVAYRRVQSGIVSAWSRYEVMDSLLESARLHVDAHRIALNATREEHGKGMSTLLDVLNAQQSLIDSEVTYLGALCDRTISAYSVLAAVGSLQAESLGLQVEGYDPHRQD